MADLHIVHEAIEKRIKWLEDITKRLDDVGNIKAIALGDYDKAIAIATAKLALGTVKEVCGVAIDGKPPATLIKKLAEGMCSDERVTQEIATNAYKSIITKIGVLSATLNAKQSIFRHIS
ncbi:hypothetical protein LCGC14_0377230 [marine sediment metagenome]|uniref:Uncharacterized protein n=1 Tax=marine sediment metagenome TaxID=412755 RepID=A0A0F9TLS4_9ZZZZ